MDVTYGISEVDDNENGDAITTGVIGRQALNTMNPWMKAKL